MDTVKIESEDIELSEEQVRQAIKIAISSFDTASQSFLTEESFKDDETLRDTLYKIVVNEGIIIAIKESLKESKKKETT